MKALLAFVTLAVALTQAHPHHVDLASAQDSANNIILNGYVAPKGHVPYIVYLSLSNGTHYGRCGGSIIANTWILTAAHCVENVKYVDIYFGTTTAEKSETKLRVEKENFIIHGSFNNWTKSNDIALIRTPHVNFTNEIKKVDLPPSFLKEKYLLNVETKVCGWGNISSTESTDILHCVDLHILKKKECREQYENHFEKKDGSKLCAGVSNGKNACVGDSGGPLVIPKNPPILVGVVSFGDSICARKPGVYTRVTSYVKWIYKKTGIF